MATVGRRGGWADRGTHIMLAQSKFLYRPRTTSVRMELLMDARKFFRQALECVPLNGIV